VIALGLGLVQGLGSAPVSVSARVVNAGLRVSARLRVELALGSLAPDLELALDLGSGYRKA